MSRVKIDSKVLRALRDFTEAGNVNRPELAYVVFDTEDGALFATDGEAAVRFPNDVIQYWPRSVSYILPAGALGSECEIDTETDTLAIYDGTGELKETKTMARYSTVHSAANTDLAFKLPPGTWEQVYDMEIDSSFYLPSTGILRAAKLFGKHKMLRFAVNRNDDFMISINDQATAVPDWLRDVQVVVVWQQR